LFAPRLAACRPREPRVAVMVNAEVIEGSGSRPVV
jgi:hypothetical protein